MVPPIHSNTNISSAAGVTLTKPVEAIQQAAIQYFRLVLLAGPPGSGKTAALQSISQTLGCQVVNVNLELGKKMLEPTRTLRPRQVERLPKEVVAGIPGEVLLLGNLEVLFDTTLEVEPRRSSRICAGWRSTAGRSPSGPPPGIRGSSPSLGRKSRWTANLSAP